MKAFAAIASIAVVIVAFAAPSQGAPAVSDKECSKAAAARGERPGSKTYVQFMQQCKAGKVPLTGGSTGTGTGGARPSQYNY